MMNEQCIEIDLARSRTVLFTFICRFIENERDRSTVEEYLKNLRLSPETILCIPFYLFLQIKDSSFCILAGKLLDWFTQEIEIQFGRSNYLDVIKHSAQQDHHQRKKTELVMTFKHECYSILFARVIH